MEPFLFLNNDQSQIRAHISLFIFHSFNCVRGLTDIQHTVSFKLCWKCDFRVHSIDYYHDTLCGLASGINRNLFRWIRKLPKLSSPPAARQDKLERYLQPRPQCNSYLEAGNTTGGVSGAFFVFAVSKNGCWYVHSMVEEATKKDMICSVNRVYLQPQNEWFYWVSSIRYTSGAIYYWVEIGKWSI